MIKDLDEALRYIHWLGKIADVCTFRETAVICEGCRCHRNKTDSNDGNKDA